ncbi:MAG: hypothetical protein AB7L70_19300 [Pyrinomonadaceae bacterium]
MQFQPKTNAQIGRIFGLAKKRGIELDDDTKAGFALTASAGRTDRLSRLSFDEANVVITNLGGDAYTRDTPRRTVNYHRQQAGVQQIAQGSHLELMRTLAEGRGITEEGLRSLCRRMLRGKDAPRTTAETNKIIEALKAMNARDAAYAKPGRAA